MVPILGSSLNDVYGFDLIHLRKINSAELVVAMAVHHAIIVLSQKMNVEQEIISSNAGTDFEHPKYRR